MAYDYTIGVDDPALAPTPYDSSAVPVVPPEPPLRQPVNPRIGPPFLGPYKLPDSILNPPAAPSAAPSLGVGNQIVNTPVGTAPVGPVDAGTDVSRLPPSVVPNKYAPGRFALTALPNQQTPPTGPGINAVPPTAPNYFAAREQVNEGVPGSGRNLTKLGKLMMILQGAGMGAIAGSTQPTFGTGAMASQEWANQQAQNDIALQTARANLAFLPVSRAFQLQQMALNQDYLRAQTGYKWAQAGAIPAKTQHDQALAEAALWKSDPMGGLVNVRTKERLDPSQTGTLTAEEADALGGQHQAGETVSLKAKNMASELANRGIGTLQANGHMYTVNRGTGELLKDWGTATPMMVMNAQLGGAANPQSPEFQAVVDAVGTNRMDLQTAVSRMGRYPGAAFGLMSAIAQKYPEWSQANYGAIQAALKSFTSGPYSQNLTAIGTARNHMQLFRQLAQELNNGRVRAFNELGNAIGVEFGDDAVTNFNLAKHFFSGEVGKAVIAGGGTAGERDQVSEAIESKNSWDQLDGALKTADALLEGKQKSLRNTFDLGQQGQPNFGQTPTPRVTPKAAGGGGGGAKGKIQYFNGVPYEQQLNGTWKKQKTQ